MQSALGRRRCKRVPLCLHRLPDSHMYGVQATEYDVCHLQLNLKSSCPMLTLLASRSQHSAILWTIASFLLRGTRPEGRSTTVCAVHDSRIVLRPVERTYRYDLEQPAPNGLQSPGLGHLAQTEGHSQCLAQARRQLNTGRQQVGCFIDMIAQRIVVRVDL